MRIKNRPSQTNLYPIKPELEGLLSRSPSKTKQIILAVGTLITAALIGHCSINTNRTNSDDQNQPSIEPERQRINPSEDATYALHAPSAQPAQFLEVS